MKMKVAASTVALAVVAAGLMWASPASAGGWYPPPSEDCTPSAEVPAWTEVVPDIEHPAVYESVVDVPAVEEVSHTDYWYMPVHGEVGRWTHTDQGPLDVYDWTLYYKTDQTQAHIEVQGVPATYKDVLVTEAYTEVVPDIEHPAIPAVVCPGVEADAKFDVGIVPATCDDGEVLEYGPGNISNAKFDKWSTPSGTEGPAEFEVTAKPFLGHTWADGVTGIISGTLDGPIGYQSEDPYAPCYNEPGEVPLPAQYHIEPTAADCGVAGVLNVEAGVFNHVTITVTPEYDGPGGYLIEADTDPGYEFPDGTTHKERFVNVPAAIPFQDEDPEGPCFLAAPVVTTLEAPFVEDPCGSVNDQVTLPESTDGVVYTFNSDDVTNFDVRATVQPGFVVETVPAGWTGTGPVYVYAVDLTNTTCTGTTVPAGNSTGGLATTGGGDVNPLLPIGGGLAFLLGATLLTMGIVRRRQTAQV